VPFDQQDCQAARFGEAVLDLRPGGRSVVAVFLRIQGNGGPFWHLSRGVLHGSHNQASIDFKCVSYNDLAANPAVLGKSVAAR
jgi:hypothetical protein